MVKSWSKFFDQLWKRSLHDFYVDYDLSASIEIGFERLRELLQNEEKIEKQQQHGISAAIYSLFIKSVDKIIALLSVEKIG